LNSLQKLNPKLRERLLAAIVESSDDVIVSKTLDGIITSWNAAAERVLGYKAEEVIGKSILIIIPPELAAEEAMILDKVRHGERVDHIQTVRLTKDGRRIPVSLTISPIRDDAGTIIGASKIGRDITQQKRAEAEREELLRQAEQANRIKDEFLATLSHELRNPLNAVIGWATLLRSGSLPPEQTERAWDTVQRNLETEIQLISDLLDVSRIMSGKLRLDIRPFELATLVEQMIEVYRPAADAKGIHIHSLLDPTAGPVTGDPDRLQQAISNLLSNSVKFTPKGCRIQVVLQRTRSSVEVTVTDTGIGIPADFLPHVFDRFRQYDSSTTRPFAGLGLGLTIVRQIMELHGGSVQAHSEGLGKGASFTLALPLAAVSRKPEPARTARALPPAPPFLLTPQLTSSVRGLKVLAIDDDVDARDLIGTLLGQAEADVRTAESSNSGLQIVDEWIPNVVLCDIGMPDEDGYTFIRRLRERPAERGGLVPAAALTAYARTEDRLHILSSGFQMHLPKPVQPAELLAGVVALASLRRR
jgi:PAS domain S-box-containing protein